MGKDRRLDEREEAIVAAAGLVNERRGVEAMAEEERDSLSPVSREAEPDTHRPRWRDEGEGEEEDARAPIPAEVAQRMKRASGDDASEALIAMPIVAVGKMGRPEPHGVDDDPMAMAFFATADRHDGRAALEAMEMLARLGRRELPEMTPRLVARRSRLRAAVSGLMGVALLIALAAGLKTMVSGGSLTSLQLGEAQSVAGRGAEPTLVVSAAPAEGAAPQREQPKSEAEAGKESEDYRALMKRAYRQHERGDYRGTVAAAEAAVAADRSNANAYLLWGAALMDLGRVREARSVFGACAQTATQGPISECKYFR